jgi:hypothetical protein
MKPTPILDAITAVGLGAALGAVLALYVLGAIA